MDGTLLKMFTDSAIRRFVGRVLGPARWCRPLLSVSVGNRKNGTYLVVILQSPGPFCFLSTRDPLGDVPAPARFPQLAGAVVTGVERVPGERILRLRAEPTGDTGGPLTLNVLLFGSAGRAELVRDDGSVAQYVGGGLKARTGAGPERKEPIPAGKFYLVSRGRLGRVSPLGAAAADAPGVDDSAFTHRLGPFADAVEGCREVGYRLLEEVCHRIVQTRLKPLHRRLATQGKLLNKLIDELERADRHERVRREAETLAAYQSRITSGAGSIELPDVYDPDVTVRIELDPSIPVRAQIDKRFKRAAKLERSREHTRRRIEEVRAEIRTLERAAAAVDGATGFAGAMREIDRLERVIPGARAPRARGRAGAGRNGGDASPFRRIDLDEVWFVLVGRSNRENDELTFHTAAPIDLWFHAQHVSGSHVVLKCRGSPGAPPAHILEAAAAIAAHFSKARHSGLAPVIYTQRKYVRKPRGAKPGQVLCEREKMVMVAPGLPDGDRSAKRRSP